MIKQERDESALLIRNAGRQEKEALPTRRYTGTKSDLIRNSGKQEKEALPTGPLRICEGGGVKINARRLFVLRN